MAIRRCTWEELQDTALAETPPGAIQAAGDPSVTVKCAACGVVGLTVRISLKTPEIRLDCDSCKERLTFPLARSGQPKADAPSSATMEMLRRLQR